VWLDCCDARGQIAQSRFIHKHRLHAVSLVFNDASDDQPPFGDEQSARTHQLAVADVAICRDSRVICTVNSLDGHKIPLLVGRDDGIVVKRRIVTADEYLYDMDETNRIRELAMGVLREPPAPFFSHQSVVLKIARLWSDHVEPQKLGRVAVAPLDVVLDRERALIVQPDVLFVSTERLSIINDQVWGAPDLVAEVLSPGSEQHDRGEKLGWYRQYGVRECWLIDLSNESVVVIDFVEPAERTSTGIESIRSAVLPALDASAFGVFA
jgi:Uma2 family endonuclease